MSDSRQSYTDLSQGMSLRAEMLDEIDLTYDEWGGETPDHLIVSEKLWDKMKHGAKFETLSENKFNRPGYLGMQVWHSESLDKREKRALLMSSQAFEAMVPKAANFK